MFLEEHPFAEHLDLQALREKYVAACSFMFDEGLGEAELQIIRGILESELPFVRQISDEEMLDLTRDPEKLRARAQQEAENSDVDEDVEDVENDEFEDEDDAFIDEMEQEALEAREQWHKEVAALFSASAANRMYKQLAKIFHPDREMDEAAKQDKHHLMVQLAQAKQNNDIWTIISLYQQHIDPDGGFAEKDLPEINQLLAEQVISMKWDYRHREHDCDPATLALWNKFGDAKTPQALEKKLNRHTNEMKELLAEENKILEEMTNLKVVKHYLAKHAKEMESELDFLSGMFK